MACCFSAALACPPGGPRGRDVFVRRGPLHGDRVARPHRRAAAGGGAVRRSHRRIACRAEHANAEARDPRADAYRRLGEYLAARYRISAVVATDIVSKAHAVGRRLELDPALILAIISVESRFNPVAESAMGAKGLMQVIPRFHAEKIASVGGEHRVFELEPNITVGARILKEYMRHTGDLFDALQMYVGASSEEDANEYSEKVARERDRLDYILRRRPPAT